MVEKEAVYRTVIPERRGEYKEKFRDGLVAGTRWKTPRITVTGPEPGETGRKDTVIAYPGEITRLKAKFDLRGLYVWHCHILEHEDNEMTRPSR